MPTFRVIGDIRRLILQYFFARNKNATSSMGKKGSAVKISDIKTELRQMHELSQQEVQSNLTYLISQGWVEERAVKKEFRAKGGTLMPTETKYYLITAEGIDKIEGPGEFTMPKFHGININATGQNIITLGDGNKIDAQFTELGRVLVKLREAITKSDIPENEKLNLVADIYTIQSQLAKPEPNRSILTAAWDSVKAAATISGCADFVHKASDFIEGLL